ncbi:hypothetical protein HMPREF0208_00344 [Citrobacter koseri]|nr:hypothetical protein HMPREF0208_00344 [Citrobacter koseri]
MALMLIRPTQHSHRRPDKTLLRRHPAFHALHLPEPHASMVFH